MQSQMQRELYSVDCHRFLNDMLVGVYAIEEAIEATSHGWAQEQWQAVPA